MTFAINFLNNNSNPVVLLDSDVIKSSTISSTKNSSGDLTTAVAQNAIVQSAGDDLSKYSLSALSKYSLSDLQKSSRNQQIKETSSKPSLYTAEKSRQVKTNDYHFHFLNKPRANPVPDFEELNPLLKSVKDQLSNILKQKVEKTAQDRSSKILKKLVPDVERLKDQNQVEKVQHFMTSLKAFQENYQQIVKEENAKEDQFWKSLQDEIAPNEDFHQHLKNCWKQLKEDRKEFFLFVDEEVEFTNKFKSALFNSRNFPLKNKDRDYRKNLIDQVVDKINLQFGSINENCKKKENCKQKLNELLIIFQNAHSANQNLLDKAIKLESATIANLLEKLGNEHQKHIFTRFLKLFNCHRDFVNGLLYLTEKFKVKKDDRSIVIRDIVIKMLSNITKDKTDATSTRDRTYRVLQGEAISKDLTTLDSQFNSKISLVFSKKLFNDEFLRKDDSHTIPFPGIFSWNRKKLTQYISEQLKDDKKDDKSSQKRLTKESFLSLTTENSLSLIQEVIDGLEKDFPSENQFIKEALVFIVDHALIQASETENMPHFINSRLDGISETKLNSNKFIANLNSSLGITSSEKFDFKEFLTTSMIELIKLNKTTNFSSVLKANEKYLVQILDYLNCHIQKLIEKSISQIDLVDFYELYLICDIWAAIEYAAKKAGELSKVSDDYKIVPSDIPYLKALDTWTKTQAALV